MQHGILKKFRSECALVETTDKQTKSVQIGLEKKVLKATLKRLP
jgi:hypothetical protein